MGEPVEITDENFEEQVIKSDMPAVVDFGAAWCPPCRMLEPVLEELVDDYAGRVKVGSVNVDNCRDTAGKFGIMSVPTIIFFKDGQEVDRIIGYKPKDAFKTKIDALL